MPSQTVSSSSQLVLLGDGTCEFSSIADDADRFEYWCGAVNESWCCKSAEQSLALLMLVLIGLERWQLPGCGE